MKTFLKLTQQHGILIKLIAKLKCKLQKFQDDREQKILHDFGYEKYYVVADAER